MVVSLTLTLRSLHLWHPVRDFLWYSREWWPSWIGPCGFMPSTKMGLVLDIPAQSAVRSWAILLVREGESLNEAREV